MSGRPTQRRTTSLRPYVADRGVGGRDDSMDDNNNAVSSHDKLNGSGSSNDDAGDEGKGMPEKRERTAAEIRKVRDRLFRCRSRFRLQSGGV